MPCASTLEPGKRFMSLFVGPKHSGKTVAACSFMSLDQTRRVKVLDFDGRIRGILGAPWIDKSRVDYEFYPPRLTPGQKTNFARLNEDLSALQTMCSVNQNPYDTLICDSLTAETFALLCDAIPLTHQNHKGKSIGTMSMPGPEDYGFEANGTYQLLAFLRSLPIPNIIVTAHIIDRYGKLDPDDKYSETVITGEKLSLRDKIGANISIYFDHIFRFDRRMVGGQEKFFVKFRSDIACTSYAELPTGEIDITGLDFQKFLLSKVAQPPASSNQIK